VHENRSFCGASTKSHSAPYGVLRREIIESGMNFSRRVAVRDQLAGGTRTAPTDSSLKYFVELQPPSTAIT
jgi:hypothetical protein